MNDDIRLAKLRGNSVSAPRAALRGSQTLVGTVNFPEHIELRKDITVRNIGGVQVSLPDSAINDSDKKEFRSNAAFEKTLSGVGDGIVTFNDVLRKSDFIRTYMECIDVIDIGPRSSVLELGADHGWASVILKARFPDCYVVASDLVPDCIKHTARYERLMEAFVDEKWAFSVRDMPFADGQFDRIVTFAAFHHFGDHCDYEGCLREIARVLRPGGKLVLLYEPAAPEFLYKAAYDRANRNRAIDGVDEDVLVPKRLAALAGKLGLSLKDIPFPFSRFRPSFLSAGYYFVLSKVGWLHRFIPCTYNFVLTKQP